MSILLIACCGNLTPEVVDYAKNYSILETEYKPNILALFIGLVSKLKSMHDNRSGLPFSGVTFWCLSEATHQSWEDNFSWCTCNH